MPQTRMFRDRMVSMEQTFEGGERHLELLKTLCHEAMPEFEYVAHFLDHERDLFVMDLAARDGRRKRVCWTRMVLFDAERIPVLSGDPRGLLRAKIVQYLRARASRPEIVVTFRHLEEGWVDAPEPRRERRRRRRGRGAESRSEAAEKGGGRPRSGPSAPPRPPRPTKPAPPPAPPPAQKSGALSPDATRPEGRRRFRRRRRRGRGSGGAPAPPFSPE
ncbi:MAG TPA: hypothetical protein VGQ75_03415 [Thermoanaerobaculia bacterium]|nr:hypothetical protein [Thermoanaerobaculia bacterium]